MIPLANDVAKWWWCCRCGHQGVPVHHVRQVGVSVDGALEERDLTIHEQRHVEVHRRVVAQVKSVRPPELRYRGPGFPSHVAVHAYAGLVGQPSAMGPAG